MASYQIEFRRSAEQDLRRIPSTQIGNILARIDALADDPIPRQAVKLQGAERTYRLRVGSYRVIYDIDHDGGSIVVSHIRHRQSAYPA